MRKSTKVLMAKHGWRIDRAIHNYIYFAFYYPYVWILSQYAGKLLPKTTWLKPMNPILRMITRRYHAKMLSGDNVKKILALDEDISALSEKNKRIVPFTYAYKILFKNPQYIAVMDCPCKRALGVTDPALLNSCICVGRDTAEFWIDRCGKKYNARRITQEEALYLIQSFRKKGYISQAFFKVATGGSTGVVCSCHTDSCSELRAHLAMRACAPDLRMTADSGYSVRRDPSRCMLCGTCAGFCQFDAMRFRDGRVNYTSPLCLGCGLCTEHCPGGALTLYADDAKPAPLISTWSAKNTSGPDRRILPSVPRFRERDRQTVLENRRTAEADTEETVTAQNVYDLIIVGSGVGGSTVAREATRHGRTVLLLEQGGRVDLLGNMMTLPRMLSKFGMTRSTEGHFINFARTFGGASNITAGAAMPPPESMFSPFGIDLTEETEEARKDLWIQKMPDALIGPANLRLLEAANDAGYHWDRLDNFINPDTCEEGCSKCMLGCPRGAKWTARVYAEETSRQGATLKLNTTVTRLLTENGSVTGVETAKGKHYRGKAVVLSAGISNVYLLRDAGIPEAGRSFCCDWLQFVAGIIPGVNSTRDNPMTVGTMEHYEEDGFIIVPVFPHWSLFTLLLAFMGPASLFRVPDYWSLTGIMVKVKDEARGELFGGTTLSKPVTRKDRQKLDKGLDIVRTVFIKAGAKEDSIFPLNPLGAHPSCTCPIGEVVDANLETDIRNLYCCDASVIPSALGAPVVWTLASLGKRLAKHLDQRLDRL